MLCFSAFHLQCLRACPPELCDGGVQSMVLSGLPTTHVLQAAAELLHQGQQLWSAAVAAGSDQELLSSSAGMMYFSALRQASALCGISLLLRLGPLYVSTAQPAMPWAGKNDLAVHGPPLPCVQQICYVGSFCRPQHIEFQGNCLQQVAQRSLLQCFGA